MTPIDSLLQYHHFLTEREPDEDLMGRGSRWET